MNGYFYELSIKSSLFYDQIIELLFEFGVDAIEQKDEWIIVRDEDDLKQLKYGIIDYTNKLSKTLNLNNTTEIKLEKKLNKDWIDEYKKAVKPILLDEFYIRPSWEKPLKNTKDIIIDPALAFGSGHHESTSSCLLFIQSIFKNYKFDKESTALDVGCGSGILSIAMSKLGFLVDSCDTDEQATSATVSNALLNSVSLNMVWTGSISNHEKKYDLVVANIIADVILILQQDLKKAVKNGGYLILAGILEQYQSRILLAFDDLELLEQKQTNEWLSFVFKKKI